MKDSAAANAFKYAITQSNSLTLFSIFEGNSQVFPSSLIKKLQSYKHKTKQKGTCQALPG